MRLTSASKASVIDDQDCSVHSQSAAIVMVSG